MRMSKDKIGCDWLVDHCSDKFGFCPLSVKALCFFLLERVRPACSSSGADLCKRVGSTALSAPCVFQYYISLDVSVET